MFKRMKKEISAAMCMVVVIATVLTSMPIGVLASDSSTLFAGGDGSESDPYKIATVEQLDAVRTVTEEDYHFALIDDIDLTNYLAEDGAGYNGGKGWEPIGSIGFDAGEMPEFSNAFKGNFDGNGHKISGLNMNEDSGGPVGLGLGLFGATSQEAVIKNITLEEMNVESIAIAGSLVGINGGSIENANVLKSVTVTSTNIVGGLVGVNLGTIVDSYAAGNVIGTEDSYVVGGLIGYNEGGNITNSHATGKVTGNSQVGGLVGYFDGDGVITNSYATGNVIGTEDSYAVGGLIGYNEGGNITSSHTAGEVSGYSAVGGLVGYFDDYSDGDGIITNSYATGKVTGTSDVGGLVGYFDHYFDGDGVITSSYATGEVKGNENVGGLVGNNESGIIVDSHATGEVKGNDNVGGLVGYHFLGEIKTSYATGHVEAGTDVEFGGAGGLVGGNVGLIEESSATGNVSGQISVGGLVGYNYYSIINSFATGNVQARKGIPGFDDYSLAGGLVGFNVAEIATSFATGHVEGEGDTVGGLVGYHGDGSVFYGLSGLRDPKITDSYATGDVKANNKVGGLVGRNNDGDIDNAYAVGFVTGQSLLGGLVGEHSDGAIINSYYDQEKTGQEDTGKAEGLTSEDMKQQSSYNDSWKFDDVWGIDEGINSGYPYLQYSLVSVDYDGQGNTGGIAPSADSFVPGTSAIIAAHGSLVQAGYKFAGWNTKADGTGVSYAAGTSMKIERNVSLFAQWTKNAAPPPSDGGGGTEVIEKPVIEQVVSAGESATFTLNGVGFNIPGEAIDTSIKVKVELVKESSALPVPSGARLVSEVFEITKDTSGNFARVITITLPFDPVKFNPETHELAVYWLDEETGEWVILDNIQLDLTQVTVSGDVDHFTKFAVLAKEKNGEEVPAVNLTDIAGHWAEANILSLVKRGAIKGYADGTFKPNNKITRAEFASVLVDALQLEITGDKRFDDTVNHWAEDIIATAYANGIISGYSETLFGPNDVITREQMASMIVKAFNLQHEKSLVGFADQAQISAWAVADVETAIEHGIMSGYNNGTIKPGAHTTRAEAVSVIVKALTE